MIHHPMIPKNIDTKNKIDDIPSYPKKSMITKSSLVFFGIIGTTHIIIKISNLKGKINIIYLTNNISIHI